MTSPKTFILSIPNGVTVFSLRTLRIVGYLMDGPLEENIATFGARTCCPIMLLVGSIFAMGDLCNYIAEALRLLCCGENTTAKYGRPQNKSYRWLPMYVRTWNPMSMSIKTQGMPWHCSVLARTSVVYRARIRPDAPPLWTFAKASSKICTTGPKVISMQRTIFPLIFVPFSASLEQL